MFIRWARSLRLFTNYRESSLIISTASKSFINTFLYSSFCIWDIPTYRIVSTFRYSSLFFPTLTGSAVSTSLFNRRNMKGSSTWCNWRIIFSFSFTSPDSSRLNREWKVSWDPNTSGIRKFNSAHNSWRFFYSQLDYPLSLAMEYQSEAIDSQRRIDAEPYSVWSSHSSHDVPHPSPDIYLSFHPLSLTPTSHDPMSPSRWLPSHMLWSGHPTHDPILVESSSTSTPVLPCFHVIEMSESKDRIDQTHSSNSPRSTKGLESDEDLFYSSTQCSLTWCSYIDVGNPTMQSSPLSFQDLTLNSLLSSYPSHQPRYCSDPADIDSPANSMHQSDNLASFLWYTKVETGYEAIPPHCYPETDSHHLCYSHSSDV